MTNKEKYKQAFSVLRSSCDMTLDVEKMAILSNKSKNQGSSGGNYHNLSGDNRRKRCCIRGGFSAVRYSFNNIIRTDDNWQSAGNHPFLLFVKWQY